MQKQKILKLQAKNVLLGIFRLKFETNDCDIWNQHPRFCRNAKMVQNKKNKNKCGTKNALFEYFGL